MDKYAGLPDGATKLIARRGFKCAACGKTTERKMRGQRFCSRRYRQRANVYMSARHGSEELGSSKDYVARWHHELQHYGFIRVIEGKEARLGSDGEGMAAHVRLTEHWYAGRPATRDFERWNGTKFRYQKKKQTETRPTNWGHPVLQTGDT